MNNVKKYLHSVQTTGNSKKKKTQNSKDGLNYSSKSLFCSRIRIFGQMRQRCCIRMMGNVWRIKRLIHDLKGTTLRACMTARQNWALVFIDDGTVDGSIPINSEV